VKSQRDGLGQLVQVHFVERRPQAQADIAASAPVSAAPPPHRSNVMRLEPGLRWRVGRGMIISKVQRQMIHHTASKPYVGPQRGRKQRTSMRRRPLGVRRRGENEEILNKVEEGELRSAGQETEEWCNGQEEGQKAGVVCTACCLFRAVSYNPVA
jgi:hypothetical protein